MKMKIAVVVVAGFLILAHTVAAQSVVGNLQPRARPPMGPPAPAEWLEQLAGAWGDSQGHTPPGFPPYDSLQPFPTIGSKVIGPVLQPWAAARKEATNFEIEDGGNVCRPD